MKMSIYLWLGITTLLLIACGSPPPEEASGQTYASSAGTRYKIETVATGLQVPWSIAFAADGRVFVTERPGRVRIIKEGTLQSPPFATIADVEPSGESGLMGLALHPNFAQNHFLYLSYAYAGDGKRVKVVRYRETGSGLADAKIIIENLPAAQFHAGCRLAFGPDSKLYITAGDATDRTLAQRLDSLAGKILRVNDDGSVPQDNPFVGQFGARPEIWAYGSRNSQGIDWQPETNALFETEHGPSGFDGPGGGDEVNIIERGKNYGWPVVHHTASHEGMVSPLLEYTPAVAPASGMFYRGTALSGFHNNFFFGCLAGKSLMRIVLDGSKVVSQERMFQNKYGRIRAVAEGPDGAIYFSTSNRDGRGDPTVRDDQILRIIPLK